MAIASNFGSTRPSLLLDFANVGRLDPRITFARASTARYYDGVTTAKAEENLLLQSGAMTVSPWGVSNSGTATSPTITADAGTSPDGTTTASRYVLQLNSGTSTSDISFIRQNYTTAAGQDYTLSVWVKSYDGTSTYTMQLVGAGAVQSISVTGTWQRFTVTGSSSSTQQGLRIRGGQSPTNDDSVDILVWGAQLEQRSAVTAYTATTTQPITNYVPVLLTAQNNEARFDHNPTTGAALGLEIEEQRTNLLTYSEDFADAAWTKTNSSITANTIVAPDGTLSGDKLVENTANATHGCSQNATVVDATTYTVSFYAKAAERSRFRVRLGTSGGGGTFLGSADFDLLTGTVSASSSITTSSITPVGNGCYRCTVTDVSSGTTLGIGVFLIESGSTSTYTGDGYSGLFIWGAQLEAGAFATSYIPTTTTALTRSADVGDITGSNFTDFYNNSEGTFYVEGSVNNEAGQLFSVEQGNNSASNSIIIGFFSGTPQFRVRGPSSATQASFSLTASLSTNSKYAGAYATNSFNASANGSIAADDTSGLPPSPQDNLKIGRNGSSGSQINGTIKKIAYYPVRLSNAQLQALTG